MKYNHAVCVPFPEQGHIRPMFKLAQILHFKYNFHITFINTHHNHQTLFQSQSYYNNSETTTNAQCISTEVKSGEDKIYAALPVNNSENNVKHNTSPITPTFKFESLPQGIADPKDNMGVLNSVLDGDIGPPIKEVLVKLGSKDQSLSDGSRPPVTCMVSDVALSKYTLDVAEEMGIPAVAMETCSACGMLCYLQIRQLLDKGIIPLKDTSYLTNGYLEMKINWIQSLKGISLKDMPTLIKTTNPKDKMLNHVVSSEYRALNFQAIIINTFDALEQDVLKELSSFSPNIYPIGPLNILVGNIPIANTIRPNGLSQHGDEYIHHIQWLDSQEPNSVLYVNFGTLATWTQDQLVEIAWGLANSNLKFFCVIRPNQVIDGSCFLPLEFEEEIKERGKLVRWCDQERVICHPSIGGFLTHCGWNSIIESISNGVPMICWPIFAEQGTNSLYCCSYLNIGLKMKEIAKRDEIAKMLIELMEGEKGKELKKRAMVWRKFAHEATKSPNGSSYANLESLINNVLNSNSTCT